MPGPEGDHTDDLALLTAAARAAGPVALAHWRRSPAAWDKPGGAGPVTEADLAVDRLLAERLRDARPRYGWLSEETPDDPAARRRHDRVFIVDPIDGTRAFIAGEAHFAHALAVAEGGRVTAAVVFLPALDRLYAATAAGPATCNGTPIASAEPQGEARVLTSASALAPDLWPGGVPVVRRSFRASLAWRLCLVAEGAFDAVLTPRPAWEWDIAAGALIAERAGAQVTDAQGGRIAFNAADPRAAGLIAAPPALHADFVARRLGVAQPIVSRQ